MRGKLPSKKSLPPERYLWEDIETQMDAADLIPGECPLCHKAKWYTLSDLFYHLQTHPPNAVAELCATYIGMEEFKYKIIRKHTGKYARREIEGQVIFV